MKRMTFAHKVRLDTALLIKQDLIMEFNKTKFAQHYFIPISQQMGGEKIAARLEAIGTYHPKTGKLKKADLKVFAQEILDYCDTMGIDKLLVADADYFKYLAGVTVVEKHIGEVFNCVINGFENIQIVPMANYAAVEMFPEKKPLLDASNAMAAQVMLGQIDEKKEFKFESYELVTDEFKLQKLFAEYATYPYVACDIEGTGLHVGNAEILTIAFAKDKYNAFTVPVHSMYGTKHLIKRVREFFERYDGRLIFHNGLFDVKHIVYNWFMTNFDDTDGQLSGINAMKFDDTFIMAYLTLNSTVRPNLGLKDLTYDFLGDYAEDVKNAAAIPLEDLAIYNAKDVCGTFYLFDKFRDTLATDIYKNIMEPSFKPLLKMMLNGMPLDLDQVSVVEDQLKAELIAANVVLQSDPHVKLATRQLREDAAHKYNSTHKTTRKTQGDFLDMEFNPNSANQLRLLLFDIMGFEPVEETKSGAPSTNRATIKELLETAAPDQKPVLESLVTISQGAIVLNTFIGAFREFGIWENGKVTLHGSLKLGGTQSGRLSSSDPNLQNLPSNSKWGKPIKSCFVAEDDWLFCGADFNALEDKIGAILSKDPVKLKENLQGFDGHSLRAAAFFKQELEERGIFIDIEDAVSVNRIKKEAADLRQNAKPISFLKQYGGGAGKIQKVLKCSRQRAQEISDAYDELYSVTLQFNAKNNQYAKANGYIECAFGLQLKTPRIKSFDDGIRASEERSSNNAVTQSWGMLTNRAFIEFDNRVEQAGLTNDIKLINTIHDAIYLLVRKDVKIVDWVNRNLMECMAWQEHPMLKSEIKLGAELDIGPSWDKQYTLKNGESLEQIRNALAMVDLIEEAIKKYGKAYSYDKVNYQDIHDLVTIIDNTTKEEFKISMVDHFAYGRM